MRAFILFTISLFYATAFAQERPDPLKPQGENLQVPENWVVRLDHQNDEAIISSNPDSADIFFVNMTPGWHITTGPAGIFYHPANKASGNYSLEATFHYFNPGERHQEAYGIFFGGQNLDAENQEYIYFLVRNTGEFLVKRRTGAETSVIQNWTPHDAIVIYDDPDVSSVKNNFAVELSDGEMHFYLNSTEVYSGDSAGFNTAGIYGFRINHSINVHVEDLKLVQE